MLALYKRIDGSPLKSDRMAESVDTNPVVIRRLLAALVSAGFVESRPGPTGGFVLSVPASEISLRMIYDSVESGPLFHAHYGIPKDDCPVGCNITALVNEVVEDVHTAVRDTLEGHSIDALTIQIAERSGLTEYINQGLSADKIYQHFLQERESTSKSEAGPTV